MPPSQLKRLKTSLREKGVVGPQRSKKQKRQASKNGSAREGRVQRNTALLEIREQFNPFDVRAPVKVKHEVTSNRTMPGSMADGVVGRPGITKSLGEEKRRKTLLAEMQRRKKVGGILDRRFGENDPKMTPEERALERFVKEKQRGNRKSALFDLEDAEEDGQLTHFGQSLSFGRPSQLDDFKEDDIEVSNEESLDESGSERPYKRQKTSNNSSSGEELSDASGGRQAERPKTKKEVMNEIIAKSKLHKYERQQAKEDDDELRAELDKGLPDVYALLQATPKQTVPAQKSVIANASINPDRAALLNGKDRSQADKEYDERLRQMAFDQRSKPTERTMTEEEKLQKEAQRLKELEERRLQRMRGEQDSSDEDATEERQKLHGYEDLEQSQDDTFGLGFGLGGQTEGRVLGVEDEDEFIIEDDLVANESDVELSESDPRGDSENESSADDENDMELVEGLLSKNDVGRAGLALSSSKDGTSITNDAGSGLAYTYACPQSHDELLRITTDIALDDFPIVVQRIRALYHPKLHKENKAKLGTFSAVLVDHVSYLANQAGNIPFFLLENLIRHIHSLAKTFSEEVGRAFRSHLKSLHEDRPTAPTPGDLILLTAIASIFPTSDHFHQVVTPATLCMTRYLSQKIPQSLSDLATGTFQASLCLQYQRVSRRYIPELVNYAVNTLLTLAPVKGNHILGLVPYHAPTSSLRIEGQRKQSESAIRQLRFLDIIPANNPSSSHNEELKHALVNTHLKLVTTMAELWADKPAFCEAFDPVAQVLGHLSSKICSAKLSTASNDIVIQTHKTLNGLLHKSHLARRPLALHSHRPLAIKTAIPKFEESYVPGRRYDPDRDRAEHNKLKAEHRRERKGALRELRKDANFMARESLREKRERDGEYERKFKRLVAEIQGEEGREKKSYEREKRMRKGRK
ncbi:nucleolar complex protein 14 [Pseudocyphellaria aurata]|nr:nucleolar complex protein 14 [Pseudocyphellaria aurata]